MERKFIDLHSHSTVSDGSESPTTVVRTAAVDKNLKALALSDHDTVEGLDEAYAEAEKHEGFELIPAIEISAEYGDGTIHILGYFLDRHSPELLAKLKVLQDAREERNPQIIAKLNELGMEITEEEVAEIAGKGVIGRPHIARALINRGHVKNTEEAFDKYLAKNGPAYINKERFSQADSIKMIHDAGGVAVLAHPKYVHGGDLKGVEELIASMAEQGLDGLEVFYSSHNKKEVKWFKELADKYGLIATGGSDFHGVTKPDIEIGTGMGNLKVSYEEIIPKLREKAKSYQ